MLLGTSTRMFPSGRIKSTIIFHGGFKGLHSQTVINLKIANKEGKEITGGNI